MSFLRARRRRRRLRTASCQRATLSAHTHTHTHRHSPDTIWLLQSRRRKIDGPTIWTDSRSHSGACHCGGPYARCRINKCEHCPKAWSEVALGRALSFRLALEAQGHLASSDCWFCGAPPVRLPVSKSVFICKCWQLGASQRLSNDIMYMVYAVVLNGFVLKA